MLKNTDFNVLALELLDFLYILLIIDKMLSWKKFYNQWLWKYHAYLVQPGPN